MKKIIVAIIIVSVCIGGALLTIISPSLAQKYPSNQIIFSFPDNSAQVFYSNFMLDQMLTLRTYTLEIFSQNGAKIENPTLLRSNNVAQIAQEVLPNKICFTFQISFGNQFWIELQSKNFETKKQTFSATEYVQESEIALKILAGTGNNFQEFAKDTNNILYVVNSAYAAQANADGCCTALTILPYCKSQESAQFEVRVAESGCLSLVQNEQSYTISAKHTGSSYVTVSATDGSGAERRFLFEVRAPVAQEILNLPSNILIDMSANAEYVLENLAVQPIYAQNYSITFLCEHVGIFEVLSTTIVAQTPGTTNLIVGLDNKFYCKIPVEVIYSAQPEFTFSLNQISVEGLGDNIEFDEENSIIILHSAGLADEFSTIVVDVGIRHFAGGLSGIEAAISDPNNIVAEDASTPNFGIGTQTYLPYSIIVWHSAGEVEIEFSKTILGENISKTLKIVVQA